MFSISHYKSEGKIPRLKVYLIIYIRVIWLTHRPTSGTFGPVEDLPHLHAPLWQELSSLGHGAAVLPVSHAGSHINQKGCGGDRRLPLAAPWCQLWLGQALLA